MTINEIRKEFRLSKKDRQSFNTLAINTTRALSIMEESKFITCVLWAYSQNGFSLTIKDSALIAGWNYNGAISPDVVINVMCAISVEGREVEKEDVDNCHRALWRNVYNGKLVKEEVRKEGYTTIASIGSSYAYKDIYVK